MAGDDTADPADDTPLGANLPQIRTPLTSSVSYAASVFPQTGIGFQRMYFQAQFYILCINQIYIIIYLVNI